MLNYNEIKEVMSLDIGRVTAVYPDKMTLDLIGVDGDEYKNIRFLSLYSHPTDGNGAFMVPEVGSFGVVLKVKNQYFCFGFLLENPENRDVDTGDFLFETKNGNKVHGHSDGRITIETTSMNSIELFPESGAARDSYGYDNLLRAIIENFEITTGGSFHKRSVNKKEDSTNLYFEYNNKPRDKDNPDFLRGNVGSQGPTGNDDYIFTCEIGETSNSGDDEEVNTEIKVKPNGDLTIETEGEITLDADGDINLN